MSRGNFPAIKEICFLLTTKGAAHQAENYQTHRLPIIEQFELLINLRRETLLYLLSIVSAVQTSTSEENRRAAGLEPAVQETLEGLTEALLGIWKEWFHLQSESDR